MSHNDFFNYFVNSIFDHYPGWYKHFCLTIMELMALDLVDEE